MRNIVASFVFACLLALPSSALPPRPGVTLKPVAAGMALGPDELAIRWLGTAGFEIRTATTTVLIDPYLSRVPLWRLLTGPARPDEATIRRYVGKADAVFIGHGHFDHLLDAPTIARLTGAKLYGSADSVRLARAEGLPIRQLGLLHGGETIRVGDLEVVPVRSAHSDVATQWVVRAEMPPVIRLPMGFRDYGAGQVFGFWLRWRGHTLYHCGSAQFRDAELQGRQAETVLVCLAGWKSSPDLWGRIRRTLKPRVLMAMHFDNFFRPLTAPLREVMFANKAEALKQMAAAHPGAQVIEPVLLQEFRLAP